MQPLPFLKEIYVKHPFKVISKFSNIPISIYLRFNFAKRRKTKHMHILKLITFDQSIKIFFSRCNTPKIINPRTAINSARIFLKLCTQNV